MASNRVIGANGAIPWHLPEELKRFKSLTMGHHIIMGRKTWESIGRLLPGRTTVIVTRQPGYRVPGAIVAHSLDEAIAACGDDDEIFVIGGAELYAQALAARRPPLPHDGRCRGCGRHHHAGIRRRATGAKCPRNRSPPTSDTAIRSAA